MADSSRVSLPTRSSSVRPAYKIICYIAAWLVALFATNPDGGLRALAWMFPVGLAAFINPHRANSGGWGIFGACIGIYLVHAHFYFRSRSLRSTLFLFGVMAILLICNVSGVPGDDPYSLKTITGPLSKAELAGRWGHEKKFVLE